MTKNLFDRVAPDYEQIHNRSLPPGVRSDTFVTQKAAKVVQWITDEYADQEFCYLDFGCGNGRLFKCLVASDLLQPLLAHNGLRLFGFDTSVDSLKEAKAIAGDDRISLVNNWGALPQDIRFDLVISCNVFHHIPPAERAETVQALRARMKANATLIIWEHNPFNPLTRLIVKACPFDKDAHLLRLTTTISLFQAQAFRYITHAYLNVLPPGLHRWPAVAALESKLAQIPMGAQYWVMFKNEGESVRRAAEDD
ncbi:MAG: class I SAM-dependent methyltransferase [Desulfobulbaceae bacterium]|nr:class I SAM-dependent methyltransferase [Desulfobulbaceae bacterium]